MKRTEKIEIRVSLEEKDRLSELAKQDGDSVSGLIRGLVEKYVALNSPSTRRRLPKWQMAGLFIIAMLTGHALTLLPMHLHERGHASQKAEAPVYYVHGAISNAAFGVSLDSTEQIKALEIQVSENNRIGVNFAFLPTPDNTGKLSISVCEFDSSATCNSVYEGVVDVERIAPSVLGGQTQSGLPVHVFVQEMA